MTDKKKPNLTLLDLSKKLEEKKEKTENKISLDTIKNIEYLLGKAKKGEVKSMILDFSVEVDESKVGTGDEEIGGFTTFFNKELNLIEIIGTIEVLKSTAFSFLFSNECTCGNCE